MFSICTARDLCLHLKAANQPTSKASIQINLSTRATEQLLIGCPNPPPAPLHFLPDWVLINSLAWTDAWPERPEQLSESYH